MKLRQLIVLSIFSFLFLTPVASFSGMPTDLPIPETDSAKYVQVSFFDLRERESYVQVTNTSASSKILHVQVFDVSNDCGENNFFDDFTGNDTHVYNMRDIQTNDGDDAGLVLPDDAYGIVVIYSVVSEGGPIDESEELVGNFRILDDLGYEYRTNSQAFFLDADPMPLNTQRFFTFNFNTTAGTSFADVVGVNMVFDEGSNEFSVNPLDVGLALDVDLFNNAEVPFSCRDVAFVCANDESPVINSILESAGVAVAAFEYGINNALPHSKGGEVLCSGNIVGEGHAKLTIESVSTSNLVSAFFVGLNNGNGRGSMDSLWDPLDTDFIRDLLIGDSTVIESEDLVFPVSLTTPSDEEIEVELGINDIDTDGANDFNEAMAACSLDNVLFTACTSIVFPPGVTMAYYLIPTVDDDIFEPNEDLELFLNSVVSGEIRNSNEGTGTIQDDQMPPDLTILDSTIFESGGSMLIDLELSVPSSEPITVELLTADGTTDTATEDSDYTSQDGVMVTFTPMTLMQSIMIPIIDDGDCPPEPLNEFFIIDVANVISGQLGTITPGTGTIVAPPCIL